MSQIKNEDYHIADTQACPDLFAFFLFSLLFVVSNFLQTVGSHITQKGMFGVLLVQWAKFVLNNYFRSHGMRNIR